MGESSIHAIEIVLLLLLLFVVAFAALARKLQTPYPIVLVIGGLLLGFVPGIPRVILDPNLIFFVVLPPLLYHAAWVTSWRDFSHNLVSITSLAIGLVAFTVLGVAQAGHLIFPGFGWQIGFVLGAVVSTTDAIAATSIAKRIGLPQRIVDILEGESLVNDATGLLALQFATAMVVHGQAPTIASGFLRLVYLILVGLAVGLLLGRIVEWFEHRIDDAAIEIAISILVPYAGYLGAEAIHASGVLAVVACGLYLSRKSSHFFSPVVRIEIWAVWNSLTFILNGLVFVLVGLQLPYVLRGIGNFAAGELLLYGALFSGLVIVLRLLWTFPGAYVAYFIRSRLLHQNEGRLPARQVFVIGWTGMRGVIALAAALSLPQILSNGNPFPYRNMIVFLTFSVILVTLVFQGLTLPPLIRALGLAREPGLEREKEEASRLAVEAALDRLEELRAQDQSGFDAVYDDLAHHYKQRLANLSGRDDERDGIGAEQYARYLDLSRELLAVERRTAVQLRNERRINDEVLREMEYELDLSETRLDAAKRA